MAKFLASLGAISGKLGGLVFANNRFSPYIRNFVKPVDPKSTAQLRTRANFADASGAWHTLTDSVKGAWNTFAGAFYDGVRNGPNSSYTGINAFNAMRLSAKNADFYKSTFTVTTPSLSALSLADFIPPLSSPPAAAISGGISTSTSTALDQTLTGATLTAAGVVGCTIAFPSSQAAQPLFVDPITLKPVGYVLTAGLPSLQKVGYKGYEKAVALAYFQPIISATGWTSSNKIVLSQTIPAGNISRLKKWFAVGDAIQISAYAISQDGQQKKIGTVDVVVA